MSLFLIVLFICLFIFGFANAECQYASASDMTRYGDSIPWKFRVYTGKNCTGEHWEGFRGHVYTSYVGDCTGCLALGSSVSNKVESFVFSTSGAWFDYEYEAKTLLAVHVCIGKSKGKWMKNTSQQGKTMSAFKVCYEKQYDYAL
ncbi:hypothetical protein BV22DRAFT_1043988 [Leucogyrophana mollusca]|uniref:Uncharacterized protein n=1 Tax=Leucogyrophana mollusca TaxID=85980 RepID=A0ACB8BXK6_9AGAM|nr:hypothetical protein BV22DRAFT_1043988 [Leucogyrophana mollusca]